MEQKGVIKRLYIRRNCVLRRILQDYRKGVIDKHGIIIATLGILGAALIAGGTVGYRKSSRTGVKTVSAACIASGAVMWALLAVTTPVSSSYGY